MCDSGKDIFESAPNKSKLLLVKLIAGGRFSESILYKNFAVGYKVVLMEDTIILNELSRLWILGRL